MSFTPAKCRICGGDCGPVCQMRGAKAATTAPEPRVRDKGTASQDMSLTVDVTETPRINVTPVTKKRGRPKVDHALTSAERVAKHRQRKAGQ